MLSRTPAGGSQATAHTPLRSHLDMEITRDKVDEKVDFWMGVMLGAFGGIVLGAMVHAVAEPALDAESKLAHAAAGQKPAA